MAAEASDRNGLPRLNIRIINPTDNSAPIFKGSNITDFLKNFKDIIIATGVTEVIIIKMLPTYIKGKDNRDIVKSKLANLIEWL